MAQSGTQKRIQKIKEKLMRLPRPLRMIVGVLFILFGIIGFLPILGFWMVPVGLAILAIDVPPVQRFTQRVMKAFNRWRSRHKSA